MKWLIFLLILLLPINAMATEYHVASSGGDYTTIAEANAVAVSGDIVSLNKGDTFIEKVIPVKGVTYNSYGTGEKPVLDGNNTLDYGFWINDGVGDFYNTIQDIEIKNFTVNGIQIGSGQWTKNYHVTVDNATIHDMSSGIVICSSSNIIRNCEIYNQQLEGVFSEGNNIEIGYCNIYGVDLELNRGDAIQLEGGRSPNLNFYIHHNTLTHPSTGNKGVFTTSGLNGQGSGIFEHNICIGGGWGFSGIQDNLIVRDNLIQNSTIEGILCSSNNGQYYNNIIINSYNGLGFTKTTTSMNIYHNTVIGAINRGISANSPNTPIGIFKNNILYNCVIGMVKSSTANFILDYNSFYPEGAGFIVWNGISYNSLASYQLATNQDLHSISADPLLNADYTLKSNSPCIGAGVDVGIRDDYAGNPRPQGGFDIGAYEHQYTSFSKSQRKAYQPVR